MGTNSPKIVLAFGNVTFDGNESESKGFIAYTDNANVYIKYDGIDQSIPLPDRSTGENVENSANKRRKTRSYTTMTGWIYDPLGDVQPAPSGADGMVMKTYRPIYPLKTSFVDLLQYIKQHIRDYLELKKNSNAQIQSLLQEKERLESNLARVTRNSGGKNEKVSALETQLATLNVTLSTLRAELESRENKLKTQAQTIQTQVAEITRLGNAQSTANARTAELQTRINTLQTEKERVNANLASIRTQKNTVNQEVVRIRGELDGKERELAQKNADMNAMRTQHELALQAKGSNLTEANRQAHQNALNAKQEEISRVTAEKEQLQTELNALRTAKSELNTAKATQNTELASLREQLNVVKVERNRLNADKTAVDSQIAELTASLAEKNNAHATALGAKNAQIAEEARKHASNIARIQEELTTSTSRVQALEEQIVQKERELETATSNKRGVTAEKEQLQKELNQVRAQIEEKNAKLAEQVSAMNALEKEKNAFAKKAKECNEIQKTVNQLANELKRVKDEESMRQLRATYDAKLKEVRMLHTKASTLKGVLNTSSESLPPNINKANVEKLVSRVLQYTPNSGNKPSTNKNIQSEVNQMGTYLNGITNSNRQNLDRYLSEITSYIKRLQEEERERTLGKVRTYVRIRNNPTNKGLYELPKNIRPIHMSGGSGGVYDGVQINNKQYGPYREVFFKGNEELTSENDLNSLYPAIMSTLMGRSVIIFGYGLSGSGKTYTLLGASGTNGVLQNAIRTLTNKNATVTTHSIFDYGIASFIIQPGTQTTVKTFEDKITKYYGENLGLSVTLSSSISIRDDSIETQLSNVETTRKQYHHITKTPNNPNSSRTHLFIVLKVTSGNNTGYLTFVDMGGRETPDAIAKQFFYKFNGEREPEVTKTSPSSKQKVLLCDGNTFLENPWGVRTLPGNTNFGSIFQAQIPILTNYRKWWITSTKQNGTLCGTNPKVYKEDDEHKNIIQYDNEEIIKILKSGFFINETINHLVYYLKQRMGDTMQVEEYTDLGKYQNNQFIQDPKNPPSIRMQSILDKISKLGHKNNADTYNATYIMICAVRQEPEYKNQTIETLKFASSTISSSSSVENHPRLLRSLTSRTIPRLSMNKVHSSSTHGNGTQSARSASNRSLSGGKSGGLRKKGKKK